MTDKLTMPTATLNMINFSQENWGLQKPRRKTVQAWLAPSCPVVHTIQPLGAPFYFTLSTSPNPSCCSSQERPCVLLPRIGSKKYGSGDAFNSHADSLCQCHLRHVWDSWKLQEHRACLRETGHPSATWKCLTDSQSRGQIVRRPQLPLFFTSFFQAMK